MGAFCGTRSRLGGAAVRITKYMFLRWQSFWDSTEVTAEVSSHGLYSSVLCFGILLQRASESEACVLSVLGC